MPNPWRSEITDYNARYDNPARQVVQHLRQRVTEDLPEE
jgi:hypothetical protein